MNYTDLINKIIEIFVDEDKYVMKKVIEEFEVNGTFAGDVYTFLMYEPIADQAPRIYQVGGPFDLVSNKAPQQALVWQDGKLILNEEFTEFVDLRTGIMDSLVVKLLGKQITAASKVLMYGTGKTALWSAKILKNQFPELQVIDYINSSNSKSQNFESELNKLNLLASPAYELDISQYDYIFCHTNSKTTLLDDRTIQQIKNDCLITTYLSSTDHGEVADAFYNKEASILIDWDQNINKAKDLHRAINNGFTSETDLTTIKALAVNGVMKSTGRYTIFRSQGTPMQNLATLKVLIQESRE